MQPAIEIDNHIDIENEIELTACVQLQLQIVIVCLLLTDPRVVIVLQVELQAYVSSVN